LKTRRTQHYERWHRPIKSGGGRRRTHIPQNKESEKEYEGSEREVR